MKTKKRRVEYFSFYNHTGIERHLTEMAKKGWLIESITNFCWTYRKIEPKDIHFCVTYYPRASDFDPEPSEDQQTFHDFCAHTGWQFACTWFQMQVFYTEKESPIPLETDPIMEVDTLHRACKKNFLPSYFIYLALGILMGGYTIVRIFYDPVGLLSDSTNIATGFSCILLVLLSLVELYTYFRWHKLAVKAAQDGMFIDTPSTKTFQLSILALLLLMLALWFINLYAEDDPLRFWVSFISLVNMYSIMLIVSGIKQGLKKAKASRGLNKFITFSACIILPIITSAAINGIGISAILNNQNAQNSVEQDTTPLSIADFLEINEENYVQTDSRKQTFLLGQQTVHTYPHWDVDDFHELPELRYTVTTVKLPALYDWCKDHIYRDLDESDDGDIPAGHRLVYVAQDPAPWGAKEAYRLYQEEGWYMNWYLLCYEDRIIEIRFDWEPTAEDMATVSRKLKP